LFIFKIILFPAVVLGSRRVFPRHHAVH